MRIKSLGICNFRRLRKVKLDLSDKSTVLVGSNNSGKTSAMYALLKFLGNNRRSFTINDVSLSNYRKMIELGQKWENESIDTQNDITEFRQIFPFIDVWIEINEDELRYVDILLPTLSFTKLIGVRLSLEPTDIEKLYSDYTEHRTRSKKIIDDVNDGKEEVQKIKPSLVWPRNLYDFLERDMMKYMSIKQYKLNPKCILEPNKITETEMHDIYNNEVDKKQFDSLIKVDTISAQRGFTDSEDTSDEKRNLSFQLRDYYNKHINPEGSFEKTDVIALNEINKSFENFESKIQTGFKQAINELSALGYPGVSDPLIQFVTKLEPSQLLDHDSVVRFATLKNDEIPCLPEKYNGLGYQNLISIVFKLIAFRDEWMQVGFTRKKGISDEIKMIQPIHLILLEEPEAHLHVQVQQVFIKKAYDVLRKHEQLGEYNKYTTQIIISTHSSALTRECDFNDLRYFKRKSESETSIPFSVVLNLSELFNSKKKTLTFVSKYLKATSFDMFFADALILVEGLAEMVLLPHFISGKYTNLSKMFVSLIEISGRYAHLLKPLIDFIQIPTLVITDLDSANEEGHHASEYVRKGSDQVTTNGILTKWIPRISKIDELLELDDSLKSSETKNVRVTYQTEESYNETSTAYPRTFEDAMIIKNYVLLSNFSNEQVNGNNDNTSIDDEQLYGKSVLKKVSDMIKEVEKSGLDIAETMFKLENESGFNKIHFATDLLYYFDLSEINVPKYIDEGFRWLESMLLPGNLEGNTDAK